MFIFLNDNEKKMTAARLAFFHVFVTKYNSSFFSFVKLIYFVGKYFRRLSSVYVINNKFFNITTLHKLFFFKGWYFGRILVFSVHVADYKFFALITLQSYLITF